MNKATLLVADDSIFDIKALRLVFAAQYNLIEARDGAEALELAERHMPSVILLDVKMPGMDGFEVCRQLKARPTTHNIPVIFVTTLTDSASELRAFDVGATDYITKPIRPSVLSLRVRNHLQLKHHRDYLADLSLIDPLTGIGNRRSFDETWAKEVRRAERNRTSLSVIVVDIDQFKQFNDQYGHMRGDECLRQVGQVIEATVQSAADICARLGGEEFAVILSACDLLRAQGIAEQIRVAVANLAIPHEASPVQPYLTVSLGVASGVIGVGTDLMTDADNRLYEAKRGGRNRVI